MTHEELVGRACRWLRVVRRCRAVTTERGHGERPDAVGWSGLGSILIEAKVDRWDFLRDARKECRAGVGVGNMRYYLVPAGKSGGLVAASEVPNGWGLLWCDCLKITLKQRSLLFPRDAEREIELLIGALGAGLPELGAWLDAECLPDVGL